MRKIILIVNRFSHYVSCIVLVGLLLLTITDILGRALFNHPVLGKYELTGLSLVIIAFFSFGYAEQHKDHVIIDFFYELMPRSLQKVVSFFSQITCLFIVFVMIWRVLVYGVHMMSTNAITASLKIPHWPIILAASIGLISFFLIVFANLIPSKTGRGENTNDIS